MQPGLESHTQTSSDFYMHPNTNDTDMQNVKLHNDVIQSSSMLNGHASNELQPTSVVQATQASRKYHQQQATNFQPSAVIRTMAARKELFENTNSMKQTEHQKNNNNKKQTKYKRKMNANVKLPGGATAMPPNFRTHDDDSDDDESLCQNRVDRQSLATTSGKR